MARWWVWLMMWLVLPTLAVGSANAQSPASALAPGAGRNAIAASLVAESDRPAAGSVVTAALVMRPEKGWHGYWQNPGDAGSEMRIVWDLPAGVTASAPRYPVPGRLTIAGLMNYVYEHDYAPLVALSIPTGVAPGTRLPVRAKLDYLACTDRICVPEKTTVATELIVGNGAVAGERRALFDAYRQQLPKPLGSPALFEHAGGKLRLAVPLPASLAISDVYFFPSDQDAIVHAAPQSISRSGDMLIVEAEAAADAPRVATLDGVLKIGPASGLSLSATPGPVPAAGAALGAETLGGAQLAVLALLGAIAGGLLLNVLPCVFPILSLKALSLARAGGEERTARREALAYAAGAILTCLALGAALLALRAGGNAVGWAFQLQDPRIILLLLLLVSAITLNLAGLFELPAITGGEGLAARGGTGGAFWTGALASFVATPCTGPFMGAALGAALVLPAAAALGIFAGLGLGLSLPFLLLGFVPALRRRLPRPGPWMARFRRWMALPMAATAIGLAWVLSRQAGSNGLALGLAATLILALALWWVGRRQGKSGAWLPLAPAALACLAAMALVPAASAPASARGPAIAGAEPFSEARLAARRAEGRPVFVYFTADWCLTCKVNEQAVLGRSEVARAFDARNVAVLAGDWTDGDAAISRFLEKHGRSGVPLYLYYPPGKEPQILPQLLTVGQMTRLVG
jgi:thiol:disulfide interchange protein